MSVPNARWRRQVSEGGEGRADTEEPELIRLDPLPVHVIR